MNIRKWVCQGIKMIFWPFTIPAMLVESVFVPVYAFINWVLEDEDAFTTKTLWEHITFEGKGYWRTIKPLFLP